MTLIARTLAGTCTALAVAAAGGLLALALTGPAMANGSGAGIVGSPHDFTDGVDGGGGARVEDWNFRGEICRTCHAPHDKARDTPLGVLDGETQTGLLWNHQLSSLTYTVYTSDTLDGAIGQPVGIAKLCLGCHDGTVTLDSFDSRIGASTDPTTMNEVDDHFVIPNMASAAAGDLRGTHPISVAYNEAGDISGSAANSGLNPDTSTFAFSGLPIAAVLETSTRGNLVQCSSCHDVHDSVGEAVPLTHLLREPNAGDVVDGSDPLNPVLVASGVPSGLCLTCHDK